MVIQTEEDVCQRCISLCHVYDLPRQNEIQILVSVFFHCQELRAVRFVIIYKMVVYCIYGHDCDGFLHLRT